MRRNGLLFGEDAGSRGEEEARRENFTVIGPWCRGGSLRIMKVRIDRNSPLPSKRVDDEPRFDQPAGYREKDGTWRGITGAASFAWKFMTDGRRSKIRRTISAGPEHPTRGIESDMGGGNAREGKAREVRKFHAFTG